MNINTMPKASARDTKGIRIFMTSKLNKVSAE